MEIELVGSDNSLLKEHHEELREYLKQSVSDSTRRALKNDMDHFKAWGGRVPASPELVASYLTAHAEKLSIATLRRRLVSITKAHRLGGYESPVQSELVQMTIKGIRRVHGKPQRRVSPILKDDLIAMVAHAPDNMIGVRDKALLLIGFAGAFRKSELVALKCNDLEFSKQGLTITIQRSKTDQAGEGRQVAIPYAKGRICPVRALREWIEQLPDQSGAIFRSVTKAGKISEVHLSARSVSNIIKRYVSSIGLDPENYSGHSLRAGLATSAAMHGISSWKIRAQTGHKSDAMLQRYIREGDLFSQNASSIF